MFARSLMLRQLLTPRYFAFQNAALLQYQMANMSFISQQQRCFAKKKRTRSKSEGEGATEQEQGDEVEVRTAPTEEPTPVTWTPQKSTKIDWSAEANRDSLDAPNLKSEYYQEFSVGDIARIASAPDHKPPSFEDTIEGRYAASLFIAASQSGKLFECYEDMVYLNALYKNCEHFRLFTENNGIGLTQMTQLN